MTEGEVGRPHLWHFQNHSQKVLVTTASSSRRGRSPLASLRPANGCVGANIAAIADVAVAAAAIGLCSPSFCLCQLCPGRHVGLRTRLATLPIACVFLKRPIQLLQGKGCTKLVGQAGGASGVQPQKAAACAILSNGRAGVQDFDKSHTWRAIMRSPS